MLKHTDQLMVSCTNWSVLYLKRGSNCDHQFEPGRKPADGFSEEGHNGVSVVRLVELGLVETVDEDNQVLLRVYLSL